MEYGVIIRIIRPTTTLQRDGRNASWAPNQSQTTTASGWPHVHLLSPSYGAAPAPAAVARQVYGALALTDECGNDNAGNDDNNTAINNNNNKEPPGRGCTHPSLTEHDGHTELYRSVWAGLAWAAPYIHTPYMRMYRMHICIDARGRHRSE